MPKLIKAFWYLSMAIFLGVILYVYAAISQSINFSGDGTGLGFDKDSFFFVSLGLLILVNILARALVGLFDLFAKSKKSSFANENFRNAMQSWVLSFAAMLNAVFVLLAFFLLVLRNPEYVDASDYAYLLYVGPVLFVVWMIGLVVTWMNTRPAKI